MSLTLQNRKLPRWAAGLSLCSWLALPATMLAAESEGSAATAAPAQTEGSAADPAVTAIEIATPSVARLITEAEQALSAGNFREALEALSLARRVAPADVDVAITYVKIQAAAGNLDDALQTLRSFGPAYANYGELRCATARVLLWMGRRDEAAAEAGAARDSGSDQAEATRLLAEIAFQSGDLDTAIEGYDAYLKAAPEDDAARTRFFQVLFERDEMARLSEELDALPPQSDDPQRAAMRALLARRFMPIRVDGAATYTSVDTSGQGNADWQSLQLAAEHRGTRFAEGLGVVLDTRRYGTRRVDFAIEPSLRYFPTSFFNTRLALAVAPNPEFMPTWALSWDNSIDLGERVGLGAAYRISSYDLPASGSASATTPTVQLIAPFVALRFDGFLLEPGVTAVFGDVAAPPLLTYQLKGTLLLSDEEQLDAWLLYGTEPFDQSLDPSLLQAGAPQVGAFLGYTLPISHLTSFKMSYALTAPSDTGVERATRVRHALTLGFTRRFGHAAPSAAPDEHLRSAPHRPALSALHPAYQRAVRRAHFGAGHRRPDPPPAYPATARTFGRQSEHRAGPRALP